MNVTRALSSQRGVWGPGGSESLRANAVSQCVAAAGMPKLSNGSHSAARLSHSCHESLELSSVLQVCIVVGCLSGTTRSLSLTVMSAGGPGAA
eukprot:2488453-Rhodomonas_salina.1